MYMHHDVQILEQVFGQTCFCSSKTFAHFFLLCTFSSLKTFGKDPLDSDHEEVVKSDTESERDESDKEPDTSKEDERAGVVG